MKLSKIFFWWNRQSWQKNEFDQNINFDQHIKFDQNINFDQNVNTSTSPTSSHFMHWACVFFCTKKKYMLWRKWSLKIYSEQKGRGPIQVITHNQSSNYVNIASYIVSFRQSLSHASKQWSQQKVTWRLFNWDTHPIPRKSQVLFWSNWAVFW